MPDRAQHVVLFKFAQELSADEESEMLARVREWPANIPASPASASAKT